MTLATPNPLLPPAFMARPGADNHASVMAANHAALRRKQAASDAGPAMPDVAAIMRKLKREARRERAKKRLAAWRAKRR